MSDKTCYACEKAASTVEHCPPISFFPVGQREQLLTVASCPQHNNDNSKDVEYTRNVLTTLWGVNESGLELFGGKVRRSLDRSPALLNMTFGTMQTVFHEGQMTGAFRIDVDRLKNVFEACARAIHYNDTGQKHPDWGIVMPQLQFESDVSEVGREIHSRAVGALRSIHFEPKRVSNPRVFEYAVAVLEGNCVYVFSFYRAFVVYALPLPVEVATQIASLQAGSSEQKANG